MTDQAICCQHSEKCFRNKITYLSFFLAIFILFGHSINIEVYELSGGVLYYVERFIKEIPDLTVPTFFAISGYLFFQNYSTKILLKKWKSRVFSLLIPYLVWNTLVYLYFVILCSIPSIRDSINNPVNGFSFLDLLKEMALGEHNFVTWFLRCLIIYTIVTPLLYWVIKNKYGAVLLSVVVIVVITIVNKQVVNFWIFYLFGACLGIHGKKLVTSKYSKLLVISAFCYIIISSSIGMFFIEKQITAYTFLRLSQVIAIWICADVVARPTEPKWWMKISFFIYLSHAPILEAIEKIFLITIGKNTLSAVVDFFAAPPITLLIVIALAYILRRIKPLWIILTGSRG